MISKYIHCRQPVLFQVPPTKTCQILASEEKSLTVKLINHVIPMGKKSLFVIRKTFNFHLLMIITNIEFLYLEHFSLCRGCSKGQIR